MPEYQPLAVLITTYQDLENVELNIRNWRENFTSLRDVPICVVSTSPTDPGFQELCDKYIGVRYIPFIHAPGNPGVPDWLPEADYISWRHKYLPARIQMSMVLGLNKIWNGTHCKYALHIHSDNFIKPFFEKDLIFEMEYLENNDVLWFGDLCEIEEGMQVLPRGFHVHPEGLLLNLNMCYNYGYGFANQSIFTQKTTFKSHNYASNEALIGQYTHYCLTRKNILKYDDEVDELYYEKTRFRTSRGYHGDFRHMIALSGSQPDAT